MARTREPADSLEDALHSLHRYFVASGAMRILFKLQSRRSEVGAIVSLQLWYGTLFVVAEGWKDLGLHDPAVSELITHPNYDLLRECRNTVFHFQERYFSKRLIDFISADGSFEWACELDDAFRTWFAANPWIEQADGKAPAGFVTAWKAPGSRS